MFCYSILDETENERPLVHRTESQLRRLFAAKKEAFMDTSSGKGKGKKKVLSLREIFGAKPSFRDDLLPRAPSPFAEVITDLS